MQGKRFSPYCPDEEPHIRLARASDRAHVLFSGH
jgi:hypothetical protein